MGYLAEDVEARRRLDTADILEGARSVICVGRRYGRAPRRGGARSGARARHRPLRARSGLPRLPPQEAAPARGLRPRDGPGGARAGALGHRAFAGARLGRARGAGLRRQERPPDHARPGQLPAPRRGGHHARARRRHPHGRALRRLHPLPRRLPHVGVHGALRARSAALRRLLDHRATGGPARGAAPGHRRAPLRLRRLPGRVPVQPRGAPAAWRRPRPSVPSPLERALDSPTSPASPRRAGKRWPRARRSAAPGGEGSPATPRWWPPTGSPGARAARRSGARWMLAADHDGAAARDIARWGAGPRLTPVRRALTREPPHAPKAPRRPPPPRLGPLAPRRRGGRHPWARTRSSATARPSSGSPSPPLSRATAAPCATTSAARSARAPQLREALGRRARLRHLRLVAHRRLRRRQRPRRARCTCAASTSPRSGAPRTKGAG